jgi:beta-lactamase class A
MSITRRGFIATVAGAGLSAAAVDDSVVAEWRRIAAGIDGRIGVAALDLASGRRAGLNADEHFPMASVCKLPIGANILAIVQEGKLKLTQEIEIPLYDLVPNVSPIAERWEKQKRFPVEEMLELMIAQSDNTAVQTFFRLGGGAAGMAARLRQWGIEGMRVDRSERETGLAAAGVRTIPPVERWTQDMASELEAKIPPKARTAAMHRFLMDLRDTATPDATVDLLHKLFRGELLSKELTAQFIQMMEKTTTGPARLKGLLPPGTVVAHKTGTTGSAGRLNGSTNDVGVIAGRVAIAVFVKGSTAPLEFREKAIAEIARSAMAA